MNLKTVFNPRDDTGSDIAKRQLFVGKKSNKTISYIHTAIRLPGAEQKCNNGLIAAGRQAG